MWLIDDDKQKFENNCLSVIHDRCLPDMQFSMENSLFSLVDTENCFPFKNECDFVLFLLAKAGKSSQNDKNIFSFQLKSAFSILILHSVLY